MIFLVLAVLAQAVAGQPNVSPKPAVATWEVRGDLGQNGFENRYYAIEGCTVWVRSDHKGVKVHAIEYNRAAQSTYYTQVNIVAGTIRVDNGKLIRVPSGGTLFGDSQRNLVYSKCGEHLRQLPDNVRKLFFGFADVR